MSKLLLIEDSKEIYNMVQISIASLSVEMTWSKTIKEAQTELSKNTFDLILLDINLPDGNGIELCQKLMSESPEIPIFILTSSDNVSDKVLGFSAGADDYITKPFSTLELQARIDGKLRKTELLKISKNILEWNEIKINMITQEVHTLQDKEYHQCDLTALEFKLLTYFAQRAYQVIDRESILNDIWGEDVHVYSRSVDTHVSKLRKKINPVSDIIESIHGAGYKFNPTSL